MNTVIRDRRVALGMTQEELADRLGVTRSAVCKWETGDISSVKLSRIDELARVLRVSPLEIMGMKPAPALRSVPVYSSIACGVPALGSEDVTGTVPVDGSYPEDLIAVNAHGNSMEPLVMDRDIVLIKVQPEVEAGEIAAVRVGDEDFTLKRVRLSVSGLTLVPLNTACQALFYTWKEVEQLPVCIIGKLLEVRRRL